MARDKGGLVSRMDEANRTSDTEETDFSEPSPLEAMLKGIAAEPEGTRFLVISVDIDGNMAQRLIGPFQVWELQGIAAFMKVQFEMAATGMIARGGDALDIDDGDDSDRVVG